MPKSVFAAMLLVTAMPGVAVLSWPPPALADEAELPGPDTQFLAKAVVSGRDELELAQLAATRASSPEVKRYAEHLITDHKQLNAKLSAAAEKNKLRPEGTYGTPPLQASSQGQSAKEQLERLSGSQFDRAFMSRMVQDHETAIAQFQDEAKNGKDTATRDLASSSVPTLEAHLKQAREINSRLGAS